MTARRARGDCRSAARGQGSAKDSAFTGITVRPALFEQGKIHKGVGTENVSSTSGLKNLRDEQMEADFWQDKFPTVCGLSRNSYRRCVQQTRGSFAQTFLSSDSGLSSCWTIATGSGSSRGGSACKKKGRRAGAINSTLPTGSNFQLAVHKGSRTELGDERP